MRGPLVAKHYTDEQANRNDCNWSCDHQPCTALALHAPDSDVIPQGDDSPRCSTRDLMPPISAAQRAKLSVEDGNWVVAESARQQRAWLELRKNELLERTLTAKRTQADRVRFDALYGNGAWDDAFNRSSGTVPSTQLSTPRSPSPRPSSPRSSRPVSPARQRLAMRGFIPSETVQLTRRPSSPRASSPNASYSPRPSRASSLRSSTCSDSGTPSLDGSIASVDSSASRRAFSRNSPSVELRLDQIGWPGYPPTTSYSPR